MTSSPRVGIRQRWIPSCLWLGVIGAVSTAQAAELSEFDAAMLHAVERTPSGYRATDADPFVVFKASQAIRADHDCLLITVRLNKPRRVQIFWALDDEPMTEQQSACFDAPGGRPYTTVVDLTSAGKYCGLDQLRIDPGNDPDVTFSIEQLQCLRLDELPAEQMRQLVQFRCLTSKLHYQPGEQIPYCAELLSRFYPDRDSSKLLVVKLRNAAGETVVMHTQQYAIRPAARETLVWGCLPIDQPLPPGRYTLWAESLDQRSKLCLRSEHHFGVQTANDPYICETPFKFLKDFSVIHGHDGRWHIFSITGDFYLNHDWMPAGQERTFSHASSVDLRDWTIHPPVLSITDRQHPDGREYYENRNIWAPHVIHARGRYWMFYTSVNQHVSQSISLATSPDLFTWTEYEHNPVFTLEDVPWARWARDAWADCRDPCVLIDGDKFYLYVTAHAKTPGGYGVVAVAESSDLIHWTNPQIAVRAAGPSESPQVWKMGPNYCMVTSSLGANTYLSDHPVTGWRQADFPRPEVVQNEHYVKTSGPFAEEVVSLPAGGFMIANCTWRHYGNTIYFWRIKSDGSQPTGFESPWDLHEQSENVPPHTRDVAIP